MMKFKRFVAILLLVGMLCSFAVPVTFANAGTDGVIIYDFQLYENPVFRADATDYLVDAATGRIVANFDANGKYAGITRVCTWFYNNYGTKINWGIETSGGKNATVKDYYFRGTNDQGLRLLTGDSGYVSIRISVPAAGTYNVSLQAGSSASVADIYMFPATTAYTASTLTSRAGIAEMLHAANLVADNASLTADGNIALGEKTFATAGDYIVVFKAEGYFASGVAIRSLTLTAAVEGDTPENTTAPEETTVPSENIIASGTCGENLTWTLDEDGTLTVSGTGKMADYSSYLSVPWISNSSKVKTVVIGDSVQSIGNLAFYGCNSLTSVTIPDSVTSIGSYAFWYCTSLTSITIPDSVTSIGEYAFFGCSSLTRVDITDIDAWYRIQFGSSDSNPLHYAKNLYLNGDLVTELTIPDGVTSIGDRTFYGCTSLTSITIPDSVTSIGYNAFYGCGIDDVYITDPSAWCKIRFGNDYANPVCYGDRLHILDDNGNEVTNVILDDSVTVIPNYAFAYCSNLTSITIPDSVTSIGDSAFLFCTSLTSVTIPDSVTSIGNSAFSDCDSLTSITIPDSVTSIGNSAFRSCSNLTSITIGDSVTSIGDSAFDNCRNLASITIGDSVTSIGEDAFSRCSSLASITIPDSVTSIGSFAFYNCTSLKSITIGDSVTTIGGYAFSDCVSLTSVTFPDSVTSIGDSAFCDCNSLTSVTIPDSVTSIGACAFSGCTSLASITIGDSVTNIGDNAFRNCRNLTGIWVDENNNAYSSDSYGVLYNKDKTILLQAPGGFAGAYTIPDSVTRIDSGAFYYCYSLTSVTIPDSVTTIGSSAFRYCYSLASITIGDSVTSIGDWAFNSCTSLTSITIPDSVTFIGDEAFSYCTSLTSVTIPNSVTSIGDWAFNSCTSLTSITIPDSVTFIGDEAFSYCTSLTSVTIPNSVTSISIYAFSGCTSLESITIPDSVTSIGEGSFSDCTSLTDVYYTGTQAQWDEITISAGNEDLTNATIHFVELCIHDTVENGVCTQCGKSFAMAIVDSDGNVIGNFDILSDALAAATEGQALILLADVVEADVVLPEDVSLDLNGHTLTADSVLTFGSSSIIDTSGDVSGLLKITEADGNMISPDNAQLPVYDNEAGGYRFFAIDVEPCAVTGGNKYWFKVKAEKFAPLYDLIQADSDVQIKVKMTWDGQTEDAYAAADLSFTKTWADRYGADEDVYITVTVAEAEGLENFKLIPIVTSGGVEISGEEM